jgi:hypothetical protein
VTPIPAPTNTLTSNLKTSSEAEPNGPSTMTRGRMVFNAGVMTVDEITPFDLDAVMSHPKAAAKALVKSPTHPSIMVNKCQRCQEKQE